MPNVAAVLKEEIRRLSRKEIREQVGPLKSAVADLRRTVAQLKRENVELQRRATFLEKREKSRLEEEPTKSEAEGRRFSPKWVLADRKRLGFSAKDYALLVGVSPLTIYNWEKGKSRPQAKQLASLAAVRGIGKREALRRLELMDE